MSTLNPHIPHPENGNGHHDFNGRNRLQGSTQEDASLLELWAEDDGVRVEMQRLAAENQQLMSSVGMQSEPVARPAPGHADAAPAESLALGEVQEENGRLRTRIEQLEQLLAASSQQAEQVWAEQQKEYEALLEEKSEVIRSLHLKVQDLREAAAAPPPPQEQTPVSDMPDSKDELQALKEEVEQQRRQLQEDEEALMEQMRQMEMTMSRERVELARQRSELQRLHNDFQHELEIAARDVTLRDRLADLQRRHQDVMNQKGTAPSAAPRPASTPNLAAATPSAPAPKKGSNGLFRRFFGSGGE